MDENEKGNVHGGYPRGIVERTNFILLGSAARAERRGNVSSRLGGICENVEIEWERGER